MFQPNLNFTRIQLNFVDSLISSASNILESYELEITDMERDSILECMNKLQEKVNEVSENVDGEIEVNDLQELFEK